jgi:hypothetical protein
MIHHAEKSIDANYVTNSGLNFLLLLINLKIMVFKVAARSLNCISLIQQPLPHPLRSFDCHVIPVPNLRNVKTKED